MFRVAQRLLMTTTASKCPTVCHGTPYCNGLTNCKGNSYIFSPIMASLITAAMIDVHLSYKIDKVQKDIDKR